MKKFFVSSAFIIAVFSLATCQMRSKPVDRDSEVEQEVMKMEREFGEALTRGDRAILDRFLADDFILTNPLGKVLGKAQVIGDITSADYEIESLINDDINVRVYGETAVATARGTVKGRYKGQDASGQFRYTRVWVRQHGRLQAVAAQSTMVTQ